MKRLWTRAVLGLSWSLGALALSCGSGGSEGLFSPSSSGGDFATSGGSMGGSAVAGSSNHAAGASATPHGGSGNAAAGAPASGEGGHPAGGSPSAMGGSAGQATAGAPNGIGGSSGAGSGGKGAGGSSGGTAGSGTAGSAGSVGALCVDNSGCEATEYCAKSTCLAKAEGHCTKTPTQCAAPKLNAVCGCNGMTYFDECLAHANRQNSGAAGACPKTGGTITCTAFSDKACVDAGGTCALSVDSCGGVSVGETGVCWVLPETCPTNELTPAQTCSEKADVACVSECSAIKSGGRYSLAGKCN